MTFPTTPLSDAAPAASSPPSAAPATPARRDVRSGVFRGAVAVITAFLVTGPGGLAELAAAVTLGADPAHDQVLHRWHAIDIGGYVTLLTVGTLLVAAWRPRRGALAVQTTLVSLATFAALAVAFLPEPTEVVVPLTVVATLLLATFPGPRRLLRWPAAGPVRSPAVLGAVVASPFLVANLADNLSRAGGSDPHALLGHWAGAAALAAALLVTVWAGTCAGPTARGLRIVAATTLLYLGLAAAAHGAHDGAWPVWGAVTTAIAAILLALSARRAGHGASS